MTVFVDTSCWFAAAATNDIDNARAKKILKSHSTRVTTDYVLLESWRLLHHRVSWTAAENFWKGLRSGVADIEIVGLDDLEQAWDIGKNFKDQEFSLTDRTSFIVMQRLGVSKVASFDQDFAIYRYGKNKREAFETISV